MVGVGTPGGPPTEPSDNDKRSSPASMIFHRPAAPFHPYSTAHEADNPEAERHFYPSYPSYPFYLLIKNKDRR